MATRNWTGSTSTDWFTAGNWDTGVPTSTDDVIIGTTGTSPTIGASTTVNTITINGTDTLTLGDSTSGNNVVMAVSHGITLSGGGAIVGQAQIMAVVTATGPATIMVKAVNSQNTPQLEFFGTISDSGGQLTLSIGNDANLNPDQLILRSLGNQAHAVNFNGGTGQLVLQDAGAGSSLTVGSLMAIGAGTVSLNGTSATGSVLTDNFGVTISTGTILGQGKLAAAVTATGAATIITNPSSQFHTLEVTGAITDSGTALTLIVANAGDILLLDTGGAAHTVSFNSASGTLELKTGAALTVGTPMAIGNGTLKLDGSGANLTDASGVTFSGGTITGAGKVNAAVAASGANSITATGGTLEVTGAITDVNNLLGLSIIGTGDRLLLDGTSAAQSLTFSASGTLELNTTGVLTLATALNIGSGTVQLDGGTLTDAGGITLSGGTIIGAGKVTGNLTGTGTVKAFNLGAGAGTLELVTAIGSSAGPTFQIANTAGIALDSTVGTGNTFGFLGANGALALGNDTGFNDTINAFNVGAGGAKTTFVDIEGHTVTVSNVTGQGTTSGTITLSDGAVLHLTNLTSSNWFANAVGDGGSGTDVYVSDTPCFCHGTMILTEKGEVAVEELAVGGRVRTLSGALKPIRWIGFGRDLVTRRNSLARPIIVRAGALADGVPSRDLHLTHGHALYLEGVLVPVENLVNHRSIVWDEASRAVEYYHVELDNHDLLIADGAAAESYYDAGNRAHFHNTRPGSAAGETAPTCVPVLNGGAVVERVWRMLFARAGGQIERYTTDDPDLHLVVDGERCDPAPAADGVYRFALAGPPAGGLRLCSRSGVPSLVGITAHDHRRLGVAISRIELAQASLVTAIGHDAPLFFAGGSYPPEAGYSWTDGELALPARLFAHLDGPFTLTIHTERPGMRYPLPAARAAA